MKLTLGNIRNSRIPSALKVCSDDARLVQWANEAQERLLNRGRWYGSVARGRFCVDDGCLVWPREVLYMEQVNLCGRTIPNHNFWYEFTQYVNPYCDSYTCSETDPALVDRGLTVTVADINGTGKKVIAYATHADDVGKRILVQGRDENNQWIRTDDAGSVVDGEYIVLSIAGTVSTKFFDGGVSGIQKDETDYDALLYQYDNAGGTVERLLGRYQPNETNPQYRKSLIRNLSSGGCCTSNCDDLYMVEGIATLQHVPVAADTDWLIIQNEAAMKFGMLACKLEEIDDNQTGAEIEFKKAIRELKAQNEKAFPSTNARIITTGHGTAHPDYIFGGFI